MEYLSKWKIEKSTFLISFYVTSTSRFNKNYITSPFEMAVWKCKTLREYYSNNFFQTSSIDNLMEIFQLTKFR